MKLPRNPIGLIALTLMPLAGCGNSVETTASVDTSSLSKIAGSLAVTSPTAASSTSASRQSLKQTMFAQLKSQILGSFFYSVNAADPSEIKPFSQMVASVKSDIASSDPTTVGAKVGNLSVRSYSTACFGPTWTDDATGSSTNRPSGDLGMVDATANGTTDLTACAAAELNAQLAGAPQFANKIIQLQATLIAGLRKAGKSVPDAGSTVEATSDMPTLTGLTISSAKIARLADDADGKAVYKTTLEFKDTSSKEGRVTVYHTPKNDENSNFKGLMQAVLPYTATMGAAGTYRGLSMVYEQTDGVLTYALDIASNRSTNTSDFFSTTTGRVDFSKAAFGENGSRTLASFNTNTNQTTMHYAWQAGSQDGATRVFEISIPAGTSGSLTGFAYFGFGAAIGSLTDSVSTTAWATKMHCNWLNMGSAGSSVSKVQAQTFAQNASGVFVPTASYISFAPSNTCNAASFTITNSTNYNGTRTVAAHNLVTVGDVGTVPAVTVPSYNLPTS